MQEQPDTTGDWPDDLPEALMRNAGHLPEKVFALRQKLYHKAKRKPKFRFYALYDRIYRPDVLWAAWDRVATNDGAPGVDGVSIKQVQDSAQGVSGFLEEIRATLTTQTYRPQPVKRVYIFVIMARYVDHRIRDFTESLLEGRFSLKINRNKTRVVKLRLDETGESLDFLGYTFRYDKDRQGRPHRYLNMFPSKKALVRKRQKLSEMIGPKMCFKPARGLIAEVNLHLRGWASYFSRGYPRHAFRQINAHVRDRLTRHLKRRSQRPYRPPKGVMWYAQLTRLGLVYM